MPLNKVLVAKPRGFCAGVVRAIDIVEIALARANEPVYVRKEIVHNQHVVEDLRARGAIFVEELNEIPDGGLCILSAHGVSPEVHAQACAKHLRVIDATCPLVTKVHNEALRFTREGYSIVLIGHDDHDEVIGTRGEAPDNIHVVAEPGDVADLKLPNSDKVVYLTQTTLSVDDTQEVADALRSKFPRLTAPPKDDICYATQNRQTAVKQLAKHVDLILVIGAANSSNSIRLQEVAEAHNVRAYLIADVTKIDPAWLNGVQSVGVTAGASAPEVLVNQVIDYLKEMGASQVDELDIMDENVHFALPAELDTVLGTVAVS